jgi:hypothetical protein
VALRRCENCGRKVFAKRVLKNGTFHKIRGIWGELDSHSLCAACWEKQEDSLRNGQQKPKRKEKRMSVARKTDKPAATAAGLHLHKLEISNYRCIEHSIVEPNGRHVRLSGKNGVGKTAHLDALCDLLWGFDSAKKEPIKNGKDRVHIKGNFGEVLITRTMQRGKRASLEITRPDGTPVTEEQDDLINGLFSRRLMKPFAFLAEKEKTQLNIVSELSGLLPPVDQVERLTGERIEALEGENADEYMGRLVADPTEGRAGIFYDRRTAIGREVKQCGAAVAKFRTEFEAIGGPLKEEEQKVNADELVAAQKAMLEIVRAVRKVEGERAQATAKLRSIQLDRQKLEEHAKRLKSQIEALQHELATTLAEEQNLIGRIAKGHEVMQRFDQDLAQARQGVDNPEAKLQELNQRAANIAKINESLVLRQVHSDQLARLVAEEERKRQEHQALEETMEELRHLRQHQGDGITSRIPGVTIQSGVLRYGDGPFSQASYGAQCAVCLHIGLLQNPEGKIALLDKAESMDEEKIATMLRACNDVGVQLWMAEVARGKPLTIDFIEDGQGNGDREDF